MTVISQADLENAQRDASDLASVVNGAANLNGTGLVPTRTGGNLKTLAKFQADLLAEGEAQLTTTMDTLVAIADQHTAINYAVVRGAEYGVVLAPGQVGGIWDLSYWQSVLFQDVDATIPVTAAGQPVGCILNRLGDGGWDLIQPTNAQRPTLDFRDGVPYLHGVGTGLYTRAVHDVHPGFWLLSAHKVLLIHAAMGLFSRGVVSHILVNYSLGSVAAYDDFGGAPFYTHTAFYSAQTNGFGVFDTVTTEHLTDCRLNNSNEDPNTGDSPHALVGWAAGDVAPTAVVGVNIGEQSFGGQALGTAVATDDMEWYGGAFLRKAPTIDERAALVQYFRDQVEPEMRSTDKIIAIDSDSTWDDIDNATDDIGDGPAKRWATETGTLYSGQGPLRDQNPNDTIYYRMWGYRGQNWGAWICAQQGISGRRIFVENGSVTGSQPSYLMAARFNQVFGHLPHVDEFIWGHAHNLAVNYAAVPATYEKYLRAGELTDSMDKIRRTFPSASHMIIEPHPNMQAGNDSIRAVKSALDYIGGTLYGDVAFADIYTVWLAARPQPTWTTDSVHPTMPVGVTQQLNIFIPAYNAWQAAKPAVVAPSILGRSNSSINLNPLFDEFDGAVPDGWNKVGAGLVMRSVKHVDTELDDNYAVRMLQTAAGSTCLQQIINAVPYRDSVVVVAARQYLEPGGDPTLGTLVLASDGTDAVPLGNAGYDSSGQPLSAWRWLYHMAYVPHDANTITLQLYGVMGGTGDVYWGRAVLIQAIKPKDLRA